MDTKKITLEWIHERLQEKGMSRADLARELDVNRAAITRLFNGQRNLDRITQLAIYYILHENNK